MSESTMPSVKEFSNFPNFKREFNMPKSTMPSIKEFSNFSNFKRELNMTESTMLSIKEFSSFTGVSQSTLRYYDEIGVFPAATRGDNNYRYYVPFQIIMLNYINVLVDLGVPLSVIKDMNTDRSPESVMDLLSLQEIKLDRRLYELRTAYSIIHTYRKNVQDGIRAQDGLVRVEEMAETHYVLGHLNEFENHNDTFYNEFVRFCKAADKRRINLRFPVGGYHDSIDNFLKLPGKPNRWFSLDPIGNSSWSEGKYLVGYTRGYYGEFGDIAQKMLLYADEHGLDFKGPVYVVYLLDEISQTDPGNYLSRASVSVAPKKIIRRRKN